MAQNRIFLSGKVSKLDESYSKKDLQLVDVYVKNKNIKKQEETFKARAIGDLAGKIFDSVEVGDYVLLVGRLQSYEYKKDDGKPGYSMSVYITELDILSKVLFSSYKGKSDEAPKGGRSKEAPAARRKEEPDEIEEDEPPF